MDEDDDENEQRIDAHVQLGTLFASNHRFAQAITHYNLALKLLSDGNPSTSNRENGTSINATALMTKRHKIEFFLANAFAGLGNRRKAITLYTSIIQVNPEFVEAHANLAVQLMIQDELDAAYQSCTRALELLPTYKEAHYNLNVILRRLGKQEEAVARYWTILAKDIGSTTEQLRPPSLACNCDQLPEHEQVDSSPEIESKISIVCVKWGSKYGSEYVNKLYSSIIRNLSPQYVNQVDFVCLTDNSDGIISAPNLRCLPLEVGWSGWWNKAQVFAPTIAAQLTPCSKKCWYIDLDTVIIGCLDELFDWDPPPHALVLLKTDHMANENRRNGYNSSIMVWRSDSAVSETPFHFVYSFLKDHFDAIHQYIYKFDHWLEMAILDVCFLEDQFPNLIVEYKSLERDGVIEQPPPAAKIVCFPLQPKPHNAPAKWVLTYWK